MTETTVAPRKSEWTPPANTLWDMSDEQRKARPATQYGPTAGTVAENVQRLRKRRELSIYQLSALLRKAGRAITPAAVGKIERQQRQVTVDDLMALATVLGASPQALLLPLRDDPAETIELTGAGTVPADAAWVWMPMRPNSRFGCLRASTRIRRCLSSSWRTGRRTHTDGCGMSSSAAWTRWLTRMRTEPADGIPRAGWPPAAKTRRSVSS